MRERACVCFVCVCLCICECLHVVCAHVGLYMTSWFCACVFLCIYAYVHTRVHTYSSRGMCVRAHTHTHAHASTHSCIHTHKCCSILQYVCCRVTLRCGEKRQLVKDLRIVSASASLVRFSNLAPCSRTTELVGPQAYGLRLMLVIFGVSGCLSILMFLTPLAEVTP